MRSIFTSAFVLLLFFDCSSQSDCADFRIGKFQNVKDGILKSAIERNDSIQVEQFGDKAITTKIHWIDECSYRLEFIEGNDAWWDSRGRDRPTPDLIVRITNVNGDSYIQESKFIDDEEFKYVSEIFKVKN